MKETLLSHSCRAENQIRNWLLQVAELEHKLNCQPPRISLVKGRVLIRKERSLKAGMRTWGKILVKLGTLSPYIALRCFFVFCFLISRKCFPTPSKNILLNPRSGLPTSSGSGSPSHGGLGLPTSTCFTRGNLTGLLWGICHARQCWFSSAPTPPPLFLPDCN